MADAPPACNRCGSKKIRHARSRNGVHRLVRAWTEWDRYACGECGHRGWRRGKLRRGERVEVTRAIAVPGRRSERRDARMRWKRFLRLAITIAVGLALGYLVARFVLRISSMQPPAPE